MANLARAYALSGRRSEAVKLLNDLKKTLKPRLFECFGDCHDLCISRR